MKNLLLFFACALFAYNIGNAQQPNQEAMIKYNLFKGDYKSKNYDAAYDNWLWCLDNSPTLSVNIYKLGIKIAEHKLDKATPADKPAAIALVRRVYDQRIKLYPTDLANVYSDYGDFLCENKLSEDEAFALYQKAYDTDASKMGVKSIYRYFEFLTERNKDTNVQFIFDTYDKLLAAVEKKLNYYAKKLDGYSAKEEAGNSLTSKEKRLKKAYEGNSKAMGAVEAGLDKIIVDLSTCDRLIEMYTRDFEENKTNGPWLKGSVSRMYKKECTEDPLYDKLVEAYVAAEPSPEASVFYAGILLKHNEFNKAKGYFEKAVEQESDPNKKAGYLYKIAQIMKKKGRKSEARSYARKAISNKRSMGKAYLLIASLYASSANDCGKSEFEKKMVYVAAMNMAERAGSVDPSIRSKANKYVKSYKSSIPSKKLIFTEGVQSGTPFKINCWIGETVKIP